MVWITPWTGKRLRTCVNRSRLSSPPPTKKRAKERMRAIWRISLGQNATLNEYLILLLNIVKWTIIKF